MKFNKGDLYLIQAWDHCITSNIDEEILCSIVGFVIKDDPRYVSLTFWRTVSSIGDREMEESNMEPCKILKSTIESFWRVSD